MNKNLLCEAFCNDLDVSDVPAGFAVRTGFLLRDGDAIGFYITRHPKNESLFRVEDSGLVIPMLEAAGVNLESGQRSVAFQRLLSEYQASFDSESLELHSEYVIQEDLPAEALRFVALLLRVQDLELLTSESVENTFRDDVRADIERLFEGKAAVEFSVPPHKDLDEFEADAVIRAPNEKTLAVYFATGDARVNEAVLLWMENRHVQANVQVALLLEREKPAQISNKSLRRAMNRLDATPVYRGDEKAAMERIGRLAGVASFAVN